MTDIPTFVTVLPYAKASIVVLEGGRYLIDEISLGEGSEPEYSLTGCSVLGTEGEGSAWHPHADLTLESPPTVESWNMLFHVESGAGGDEDIDAEILEAIKQALRNQGIEEANLPDEIALGNWTCPQSPISTCVYDPNSDAGHDDCLFCHQPHERK